MNLFTCFRRPLCYERIDRGRRLRDGDLFAEYKSATGGSSPEAHTAACLPNSLTPLLATSQNCAFVQGDSVLSSKYLPSQSPLYSGLAR